MTKMIAISILALLAYLLIRYRTNEKVQQWVATALFSALAIYIVAVVVGELTL